VVQSFFISIISDTDSGSFRKIVENAPCTSASTPGPCKRARTALADNDTEWTHVDRVPDIAVYTGFHRVEQGFGLDESCEPLDFFLHFIDSELIAKMKEQTYLYSRQKMAKFRAQNKLSPSNRFRLWTTVTLSETEKLLGILLHVCISQRPNIESHWTTDHVLRCSFCPNMLSRDRFVNILSMFLLNDNSQQKKAGKNGFHALFQS
jgi:hypothetical protein